MIALLISCELIVDVEVPFESEQVTANSFINPDSVWSVQLNLNRDILDEEPFQEINDAQVIIFDGDKAIDTLMNTGPGQFRSDNKRPEPAKRYDLFVSAPPYGDVRASTSIPVPSSITSIEVYESASNQNSMLKVNISDNGAEANYYELFMELENEHYNHDRQEMEYYRHRVHMISKDAAIQDDNDSFSGSLLFKDLLFNGRDIELTFEISGSGISNHGITVVTLRTLSEAGYNYLKSRRLQDDTSGDPFAQPVNVYNNVQHGFGIFAGYSASVYTRSSPKPVILSIDPLTGKPGDHIIITGENFITSPEDRAGVLFSGTPYPPTGQIVQLTPTLIEVIVPDQAVTGKILVVNGRVAVSDSDFVVMD